MKTLFNLIFLLFCFGSFAQDVRLELLKKACSDPGAVHNQVPPNDIKVDCEDTVYTWVESEDEDVSFRNRRQMCTAATTSKPNVNATKTCEDCDQANSDFKCKGFKEIKKCVKMQFGVNCDQILEMESFTKWCLEHIDQEVATSEEILSVKETGRKRGCGYKDMNISKPKI